MALAQETYAKLYESFGQSFDDFMNGKYDQPEDNNRWTGYVIDNKDPLYSGRVKIYIIGKYDEIPEASMPWAIPDISYMGASAGNFVIPENGSVVRGYFDHGDVQKPVFDSLAFNMNNVLLSNPFAGIVNPSDYPNKMILMQTDLGECLTLNRTNGETEFRHRSGAIITITSTGTITINAAPSAGKMTINADGGLDITAKAGVINVKSKSGVVNVDGTKVQLGKNAAKQLVNNLPNCLVTGAPHYIGNTNVFV